MVKVVVVVLYDSIIDLRLENDSYLCDVLDDAVVHLYFHYNKVVQNMYSMYFHSLLQQFYPIAIDTTTH